MQQTIKTLTRDWKVGLNKSFENGIDVGYYFTGTDVRNGEGWWVAKDGNS
jgi:hypothetical protein